MNCNMLKCFRTELAKIEIGRDGNDQTETIIQEMMHIPKNFGGGFRYHDHVSVMNVKGMVDKYRGAKRLRVPRSGI